MAAIIGLGI